MLVEQLRKKWHDRMRAVAISDAPSFGPDGLMMGAGTVLVPAVIHRRLQDLAGQETRVLALLSAAYGRLVQSSALGSIELAAKRWGEGQDCLALIHLALAGLSRPEDRREAPRRLFIAEGLIKAGIAPEAILQAFGPGAEEEDLRRFDPDQPRVPAGSGIASGQWTKVGGVLQGLSEAAQKFLGRIALASLRALAENPYVLVAGLILIPKTTNLRVHGDVSEIPGLRYTWNRDEATLRLTYAGPHGSRDISATLEPDGLFHDGNRVVARLLPDGTLAIDPGEVSFDLANKDGPNLCPKPEPDKYGRGGIGGAKDKDYEDQIKLLVNPDNPTPRGYGYKFFDSENGNWVVLDDCQHHTGMRVEMKSEYDGVRSFDRGEERVAANWLDQSERQLNVSRGFELTWVFAQKSDADFAAQLFKDASDRDSDNDRSRINIIVVPRVGAP